MIHSSMIKIRINNITTLNNEPNVSLLEVMEKHGMIVESQCRNGDCGSCRCTLLSGEVEYLLSPLAFIGPKEILPCVCKAKTDIVIDDVHLSHLYQESN